MSTPSKVLQRTQDGKDAASMEKEIFHMSLRTLPGGPRIAESESHVEKRTTLSDWISLSNPSELLDYLIHTLRAGYVVRWRVR